MSISPTYVDPFDHVPALGDACKVVQFVVDLQVPDAPDKGHGRLQEVVSVGEVAFWEAQDQGLGEGYARKQALHNFI